MATVGVKGLIIQITTESSCSWTKMSTLTEVPPLHKNCKQKPHLSHLCDSNGLLLHLIACRNQPSHDGGGGSTSDEWGGRFSQIWTFLKGTGHQRFHQIFKLRIFQ